MVTEQTEKEEIPNKISAGSYDINKFLHGGYETDVITTISGPPGSGKSNFCLQAAVSQAKKGKKVIMIDTEGGFSVERAKQMVGKENVNHVLEQIMLLKPSSFEGQQEMFDVLQKELNKKIAVGLIVVDSMVMQYRLKLAESAKKGIEEIRNVNHELAKQMKMLSQIARLRNIPIIVTDQVYYDFVPWEEMKKGKERNVHMVGGDILKYWSKCILELRYERGKRTLYIRKHRSLPEKNMDFVIVNEGIKKRGWL